MRRILLLILLALAACAHEEAATLAPSPSLRLGDWRLASGKPPTRLEFAALVAACEDREKGAAGAISRCLADLGLRRAP